MNRRKFALHCPWLTTVQKIVKITIRRPHTISEVVEGRCLQRSRKKGFVDAAVYTIVWQRRIFFIGRKEGSVIDIDETQVMGADTSLAPLSSKREHVLILKKGFASLVWRQHMESLAFWKKQDSCTSLSMWNVRDLRDCMSYSSSNLVALSIKKSTRSINRVSPLNMMERELFLRLSILLWCAKKLLYIFLTDIADADLVRR